MVTTNPAKPKTITIVREYREEFEFPVDALGKPEEPTCSECGCKVGRPKCFLDMGGACPRHPILDAWTDALEQWRSSRPAATITEFYRDEFKTPSGHSIRRVINWKNEYLEECHDYIQWAFPLRERSAFNGDAPVLTDEDLDAFELLSVRGSLLQMFASMMVFYGFAVHDLYHNYSKDKSLKHLQVPPKLYYHPTFWKERSEDWITPGNHNFLRLTRIMTSMKLLGFGGHSVALYEMLTDIYADHWLIIGEETMNYWTEALA